MSRPEPNRVRSARRALLAALALAGGSASAHATAPSAAQGLYYERALMSRADLRCHLFPATTALALSASREEARGAALRAGDGVAAVDATRDRALAKAEAVDCRSPGLLTAAARLRQAFADYSKLSVMRFPGTRSAWQAERPDPRLTGARWSLVEALPGSGGWVLFGEVRLGGGRGAPALLDARRGVAPAASARLVVRDPAHWGAPVLADAPPQGDASQTILARARAAAAPALLPAGATGGQLYLFPDEGLDALSKLDPRESGRVELVYPQTGRERVVTLPLEIGDIAAARAFLAAGAPR